MNSPSISLVGKSMMSGRVIVDPCAHNGLLVSFSASVIVRLSLVRPVNSAYMGVFDEIVGSMKVR